MPTFKGIVFKHQRKKDGRYPVLIRITSKRRSVYMRTGIYITQKKINRRCFEIVDTNILITINNLIDLYYEKLVEVYLDKVNDLSAQEIKDFLENNIVSRNIDFIKFLNQESDFSKKDKSMVLEVLKQAGITHSLNVSSMNNALIRRLWEGLNKKEISDSSKAVYWGRFKSCVNKLSKVYDKENEKIFKGNLFFGVENFKPNSPNTQAMSIEDIVYLWEHRDSFTKNTNDKIRLSLVSFFLAGVNMGDILSWTKDNYKGEYIEYVRQKTKLKNKGFIKVRICNRARTLFEELNINLNGGYLFNYNYTSFQISYALKKVLNTSGYYELRRAWATIAYRDCKIRQSVIDKALGHKNKNAMIDFYITDYFTDVEEAILAVESFFDNMAKNKGVQ